MPAPDRVRRCLAAQRDRKDPQTHLAKEFQHAESHRPGDCVVASSESDSKEINKIRLWHIARHGRACPGHPRPCSLAARKTWMAGTSPAMTENESISSY